MPASIIDGKLVAQEIRSALNERIAALKHKNIVPGLAVILVGEDPASVSYVTAKEQACADIGMKSFEYRLPDTTKTDELVALIHKLNTDKPVHGILVQLPLPAHIDEFSVIEAIASEKDVDGFTSINLGKMLLGQDAFIPCTPHGIIKLIEHTGIQTKGAHAVVVGRSNIVGKPLANLLIRKEINATVTVCHTGTVDLARFTKQADILIACAGKAGLINAGMVKPGACVIDVGVNRVPAPQSKKGWKLAGDVLFDEVAEVAGFITPVPGGVGPMTITMLLFNTVTAATKTGE